MSHPIGWSDVPFRGYRACRAAGGSIRFSESSLTYRSFEAAVAATAS
jgi:hypothetical protein